MHTAIFSVYTLVGLTAQLLFTSRMFVQWVLSERARSVVNPSLFWWLSLFASLLMSFYGYLRQDLAILLGQFLSYYTYVVNLKLKGELRRLPLILTLALIVAPVALLVSKMWDTQAFAAIFLNDAHIPYALLALGFAGQLLFTLRFVVQTYISWRLKESVLPAAFWWLSLTACLAVLAYGCLRLDVVLILGQAAGLVTYVRNLMLLRKNS